MLQHAFYDFCFNLRAMDRKRDFRKPLTIQELEKLAERFLESDDDLEELDEDNLSENVDNCLELAAQKFQDPVDYANLDIENTPIIFEHELDGVELTNSNVENNNEADLVDEIIPENGDANGTEKNIFTLDKDAFKSICWKQASFEQNVQGTTFRGDENLPTNIMELSTPYQFFR